MASNPYQDLPRTSFWKTAVASSRDAAPSALYRKKWEITRDDRIATAGSCFAQHIGEHLRRNGCNVLDREPPPRQLDSTLHRTYGFSMYSARYGNIYTTSQLLQLAREAFGQYQPGDFVWRSDTGAFYDALRPGVEPEGLDSPAEVLLHRRYHLARVREVLERMGLFIFTFGLTEAWIHTDSGTVYPTAPGTVAGDFRPTAYHFHNYTFSEVLRDFLAFRELVHAKQKTPCRFLLTVSPVPLTATATPNHVMLATVYSKSVLRAVAGELAAGYPDIDYFPSYEIIANPWSSVNHYQENLRSVRPNSVDIVMSVFFAAHSAISQLPTEAASTTVYAPQPSENAPYAAPDENDVVCEEALLDAFSSGTSSSKSPQNRSE